MSLPMTINAHQLKLLLDRTADHMGSEDAGSMYGVRLDADARYLYAVATDRYTLAVARYQLDDGDQNKEPWARTIPGAHVPGLRSWLAALEGATYLTVEARDNRLAIKAPETTYSVAASEAVTFDWRGVLRTATSQPVQEAPFPSLNPDLLQRWGTTGQNLRTRATADHKPVVFFGQDFIGAQMPSTWSGLAPNTEETFDVAHGEWLWTLAAGAKDVDMDSLPEPKPNRFHVTRDLRETAAGLLRGVLDSTSDVFQTPSLIDEDPQAWYAHIRSGVANWMAYRYLTALHQADPRAAQTVIDDTAEQLDSGELAEWAWDMAENAGHNPKQWQDDHEAHVAKQLAEQPAPWARALARGLNEAQHAGISVSIGDNEHVLYDTETSTWKAVAPQTAPACDPEPAPSPTA